MIATLFNVPSDEVGMMHFSFANAAEHHSITQAIFDQLGVHIESYLLDPIPLFDSGGWFYRHQQAHNLQNAVLGISGNDLTTVDWKNPAQVASWIRLHGEEHRQASEILELS